MGSLPDKLDEPAMHELVKASGQAIEAKSPDPWLWLGHRVITPDGATVTMVDTPENQAEYPQLSSQAQGCGFPIVRVAGIRIRSSARRRSFERSELWHAGPGTS